MNMMFDAIRVLAETIHDVTWEDQGSVCRDPFEKTTCPYWTTQGCSADPIQCPVVVKELDGLTGLISVAFRESTINILPDGGKEKANGRQLATETRAKD